MGNSLLNSNPQTYYVIDRGSQTPRFCDQDPSLRAEDTVEYWQFWLYPRGDTPDGGKHYWGMIEASSLEILVRQLRNAIQFEISYGKFFGLEPDYEVYTYTNPFGPVCRTRDQNGQGRQAIWQAMSQQSVANELFNSVYLQDGPVSRTSDLGKALEKYLDSHSRGKAAFETLQRGLDSYKNGSAEGYIQSQTNWNDQVPQMLEKARLKLLSNCVMGRNASSPPIQSHNHIRVNLEGTWNHSGFLDFDLSASELTVDIKLSDKKNNKVVTKGQNIKITRLRWFSYNKTVQLPLTELSPTLSVSLLKDYRISVYGEVSLSDTDSKALFPMLDRLADETKTRQSGLSTSQKTSSNDTDDMSISKTQKLIKLFNIVKGESPSLQVQESPARKDPVTAEYSGFNRNNNSGSTSARSSVSSSSSVSARSSVSASLSLPSSPIFPSGSSQASTHLFNKTPISHSNSALGFFKDPETIIPKEALRYALDKLLKLPGNDLCADCGMGSPQGASVNLGCFVCVVCSGYHQKLGSQISKIKSIDGYMWIGESEQWTVAEIATVASTGNIKSNAVWESTLPRGEKITKNDTVVAIERFIIDKYKNKRWLRNSSLLTSDANTNSITSRFSSLSLNSNLELTSTTSNVPSSSTDSHRASTLYLTDRIDSSADSTIDYLSIRETAVPRDLLKNIMAELLQKSDNKFCVECGMRDPRWASVNLGCFLCLRCSGIHRNLGGQNSKIKSVGLDQWTSKEMITMANMGNAKTNAIWEATLPRYKKITQNDDFELIERFIINKYKKKRWVQGNNKFNPSFEEDSGEDKDPSGEVDRSPSERDGDEDRNSSGEDSEEDKDSSEEDSEEDKDSSSEENANQHDSFNFGNISNSTSLNTLDFEDPMVVALTSQQTGGLALSGRVARRGGQLFLDLLFHNRTGRSLSGFALKMNTNFLGLRPDSRLDPGTILHSQTVQTSIKLVNGDIALNENLGILQIAIKTELGIFYFNQPISLTGNSSPSFFF